MAAGLSTWFEIMDYTYQDRGNMFRKDDREKSVAEYYAGALR